MSDPKHLRRMPPAELLLGQPDLQADLQEQVYHVAPADVTTGPFGGSPEPEPAPSEVGNPAELLKQPEQFPAEVQGGERHIRQQPYGGTLGLRDRFTYHPPSEKGKETHAALSGNFIALARTIDALCPDGREKALVMTKLEEAKFWASAAVARNPETR